MIYILMIWTAVTATQTYNKPQVYYDWRPLGEFHIGDTKSAQQMCEEAAKQLGIKSENYRCVRNK